MFKKGDVVSYYAANENMVRTGTVYRIVDDLVYFVEGGAANIKRVQLVQS